MHVGRKVHVDKISVKETWTAVGGAYLHGHWEVILGLGREEHVHCLFGKRLISRWWGAHLDDVQLQEGTVLLETQTDRQADRQHSTDRQHRPHGSITRQQ